MEHQQDLAVNNITVLDTENEFGLTVLGSAVIKGSAKIHCNIHVNKEIRTCGNIIPISDSSNLGTCCNKWLDVYSRNAHIDKLTVGELCVDGTTTKTECSTASDCTYETICYTDTITGTTFTINLTNTKRITILNIAGLVTNGIIDVTINLPSSGNTKKLVIVNPNAHRININTNQLAYIDYANNNTTYQTLEFLYDSSQNLWILISK